MHLRMERKFKGHQQKERVLPVNVNDSERGSIYLRVVKGRKSVRLKIVVYGEEITRTWSLNKWGDKAWDLAEQQRQIYAALPSKAK